MSFTSWLRNLRSIYHLGSNARKNRRAARCGSAKRVRLQLECLEDRCVPAFLSPVNYAAGWTPQAVVVADFNNDSIQDLAGTLSQDAALAVRLGNGDGAFDPAINSAAVYYPHALAVGDFNADGKLDLVTANGETNNVSVLLGNGVGGLAASSIISIGSEATDVAVGDFNADGKLDLGVGSKAFIIVEYNEDGDPLGYYAGYANVLLGNGDGSFAAPRTTGIDIVDVFDVPVAVADFNGDGNLDFATTKFLLFGDGAGNLTARTGIDVSQDLAAADINGDSNPDLVAASPWGNEVIVRLGDGQGAFGSAQRFATASNPVSVVLGDFNRDTILDIATANRSSNNVSVLRGIGDGGFYVAENFATGSDPRAVAAGDFNGDGWLDAVTANYSGHNVSVLINDQSWPLLGQPSVMIYATGGSIWEGNTGTVNATFEVRLSGAYHQPVTLHYVTADDTATVADGDYQPVSDTLLTFTPGETTKTITVLVNGDRIPEGTEPWSSESFYVHLSDPTNAFFAWPASASGTIVDDEPFVSIDSYSGAEGNAGTTPFTFTVTLSAAYDAPVTVDYATADLAEGEENLYGGSRATAGFDYTATSGTLIFAAGQLSQTITVLVNGDQIAEGNELFWVLLSNPTSASLNGDYSSALGIILNDELYVGIDDVSGAEGHSGTKTLAFTVSLSAASSEAVTVTYFTANGTATAGSDYQAVSSTLTFAPGETSRTITVLVNGDRLGESNETFLVTLSNPTNAVIADDLGQGTIMDDEPRVRINDVTKKEGNGNTTLFVFTVTLSVAYDVPVTINFATSDGTGKTSDNDYVANSGTITFAPGETTKTITVLVKGDKKKEANENFFVDLSDLSSYAVFLDSRGMGTIVNDD